MVHQEMLDSIGAAMPKDAEDFKRIAVALTRPNQNVWGMGAQQVTAYNVAGIFAQMFNAPNNWKADASGKLTKNWETEEFKAGVGFARDLFQAGIFHPNSNTYTAPGADADFSVGRFAFYYSTWTGFSTVFWPTAFRTNQSIKLRPVPPFSADGKTKPIFHLGIGNFGNTYLKKASAARTKEVLAVLDYLASPFGSQEQLLLSFGLGDSDYTFDEKGNPVPKQGSFALNPVPWRFLTQYPVVQYNASNSEEYAHVANDGEKAMIPAGVQDPTLPLYSAAYANQNAVIQGNFLSGMTDIVTGRRPMSDYDSLVREWKTKGGDQMRTEFEQSLAASKA